jgi:hypothetical protein
MESPFLRISVSRRNPFFVFIHLNEKEPEEPNSAAPGWWEICSENYRSSFCREAKGCEIVRTGIVHCLCDCESIGANIWP